MDVTDEDIFASFDLDEMRALEDGDLSLFSSLLDPSFRLGSTSVNGSDSNPSPTSITPSSAEELALVLGLEEDDPKMVNSHFIDFKSPNGPVNAHYQNEFNQPHSLHKNENGNKTCGIDYDGTTKSGDDTPAPPPLVVCPIEVGKASITLQKNQLCACKECGKLFKSIWYLKQHAVRHSNERPFKCNFCHKAFKFRSNLYQHNCPERLKQRGNAPLRNLQTNGTGINPITKKRFYTRGIAYTEQYGGHQTNQHLNQSMSQNLVEDEMSHFQQLLYNSGQPTAQAPEQMAGIFGAPSIGPNMQSLEPSFNYGVQQPLGYNIKTEMESHQMGQQFLDHQQALSENNSIRNKPLDPEFVDKYLQKNRHRIHSCRKCKIDFPHPEYLQRHMTYHSDMDSRSYGCDQCPQRFTTERQLELHLQKHTDDSPHRCLQCNAGFRSALTLRRHKDQCRQCYCPTFSNIYPQHQMISPNAVPLDQYAFIDSDLEEEDPLKNLGLNRQKSTADSGMGSDSSTHSYTTSPISNRTGMEEEMDINGHHLSQPQIQHPYQPHPLVVMHQNSKSPKEKNGKSDETDSGFRSRQNSTNQSCSPGSSSFSSEAEESPTRKFSKTVPHHPHEQPMHSMPTEYQNGAYHHPGSNSICYPSGGNMYHQNQHVIRHPSNIKYEGGVSGNNWAQWGNSNSFNEKRELHQSSGPVSVFLSPLKFDSSLLSGKSFIIDRFEILESGEDETIVDESGLIPPNRYYPFGGDIEIADPRQIMEHFICLFVRRFLAVFLNAAITIGRSKKVAKK